MDAVQIKETITPWLDEMGLFLVEVKVSRDNDITITVESAGGIVTLDNCEVINRRFTETFDQDVEDYSLTVTSAGLDGEFKVEQQFTKAVGSQVEIWLKGGRKAIGTLGEVSEASLIIDGTVYNRSDINKVKYYITF